MAKLLLVDDDEDLASTLKELFEMYEHEVDVAGDGFSALNCIEARSYDLILLDWQLPDMPGLDVCQQYRDRGGKTRVLMLTGMRDASSKEAGMAAGATAILTKPFTMDQLLERVQTLLNATQVE